MHWTFIKQTEPSGPVGHGMDALREALDKKRIDYSIESYATRNFYDGIIWIGLQDEPAVYRSAGSMLLPGGSSSGKTALSCGDKNSAAFSGSLPPESFRFTANGAARVLGGADKLGLAYGLFELAERVAELGEDALLNWKEETFRPDGSTPESFGGMLRGVDRFVTNSFDESWFMSREYWDFYFKMLLSSRFNSFTLLFGFDTAYFTPPYPFLVEVPGYEQVRVAEWFHFDRAEYLKALNQIGRMCHDYGLMFTFASWQQVPWQSGQKNMVEGATKDILEGYCAAGIKALLEACPYIDQVHFRVNNESGVGGRDSAEEYWLKQFDAIAEFNAEHGRNVAVEIRAKGMTYRMAEHAAMRGLSVTVSTKYWCEQAGLPYHMTRMRSDELVRLDDLNQARRYSYSDMLRKPMLYRFVYRLWSNGSINLLTWADPDYVRRFMDSMRIGGADGFEVMAPLSYKHGQELAKPDKPWDLFDDPAYRPEGFEESRYWLFYRLFGRLGYNREDEKAAWLRPLNERYGAAGEAAAKMLAAASKLIPYVTAFHFPSHPQQEYWPETNTGGALFAENTFNRIHRRIGVTYQKSLPSDEGLFYSIDQYTADRENNRLDGRITPYQSMEYIMKIVNDAKAALEEAERIGLPDTAEARGAVLDVKMLIRLGRYHTEKIPAALCVSMYNLTGNAGYARAAIEFIKKARTHWAALSELGRAYHVPFEFSTGVGLLHNGTWGDALREIDADISKLEGIVAENSGEDQAYDLEKISRRASVAPALWETDLPAAHRAGEALKITLDVRGNKRAAISPRTVRLRYRLTNQLDGLFRSADMERRGEIFTAVIPGEELKREWDLLVYFEAASADGDGVLFPGPLHPQIGLPYFLVNLY